MATRITGWLARLRLILVVCFCGLAVYIFIWNKMHFAHLKADRLSHGIKKPTYNIYLNQRLATKFLNESTIWPMLNMTKLYDIQFTSHMWKKNLTSMATGNKWNQTLCEEPKESTIPVDKSELTDLDAISKNFTSELGGKWHPSACKAIQRVALLVPYRGRDYMLGPWLRHMHMFLQKQNLDYRIFIAEQDSAYQFNRATLLNIATKFAIRMEDYDCLITHDIDQLPENLGNTYICNSDPNILNTFATYVECRSRQAYKNHFGLVSTLTPAQFLSVNGYSNLYFGWGGEDDDMSRRLRSRGYSIVKKPESVGRYRCLIHKRFSTSNDRNLFTKNSSSRAQSEGYNTLMYEVIGFSETPLFTWIFVHIDKTLIRTEYLNKRQLKLAAEALAKANAKKK